MHTQLRFSKFMTVFALLLFVAACSDKPDDSMIETTPPSEREQIQDPLTQIYDGPAPGTQADLEENVGDRVFFGYDRFDLAPEARATLDKQAQWMQQHPSLTITVEGHADERGTREYNLALGERRANSVKNYLVALGIDPRRVNTISFGKERPAVPGANESSWAQNRRGVAVVN